MAAKLKRIALILIATLLGALSFTSPVAAQSSPDLHYYTENGIIFYEGGFLHCGNGSTLAGGAAGMLAAQKTLDPKWIPVIIAAASKAGADPLAMASLMFWEHRRFPPYGANQSGGDSDTIGRGTWQITRSSWPSSAGDYMTGVYDPGIATDVAAQIVISKGGHGGLPLGSINDTFSKGAKAASFAMVAAFYNAGQATWRNPSQADWGQAGRVWMEGNQGPWFAAKQKIIDDYIVGATYAYWAIATGVQLPSSFNNDQFVQAALTKQNDIKNFKVAGGANTTGDVNQQCDLGAGGGNVVQTARGLAWPNQKHFNDFAKSDATPAYQDAMPKAEGGDPGNQAWSDCGVFVATVMRTSGADPNYARRGVTAQLDYIKKSGKYKVTPVDKETQVHSGDIIIFPDQHTYIYTGTFKGDDGKNYTVTSASWAINGNGHVPISQNFYLNPGGQTLDIQPINQPNPSSTATGQ